MPVGGSVTLSTAAPTCTDAESAGLLPQSFLGPFTSGGTLGSLLPTSPSTGDYTAASSTGTDACTFRVVAGPYPYTGDACG